MKNLLLIVLLTVTSLSFGQETEMSELCKKNMNLFGMYGQNKMYRDAVNFFNVAVKECDEKSISFKDWKAVKYYYGKLKKETTDEKRKAEIQDSIYWVFENGIKAGADEKWKADYATALVRAKAFDKSEKITSLYNESIHNLKSKLSTSHIQYYYKFLVHKFNETEGEAREKSRSYTIDEYMKLSDYIDIAKKKYIAENNTKKVGYYKKAQSYIDQYFVQLAKDCDILTDVLSRKINTLPQNKEEKISKVKGYITLLENQNCVTSDLYGQFADTLIVLEPTSAAYYAQGNYFLKKKNISKAKTYYNRAIELEGEGENKSKYQLGLAKALYSAKSYKAAFKAAKAVQGEFRGEALVICANAIAATANSCGDTTFDRKSNYWLANDYAKKAAAAGGNISSSKYLKHAPTKQEIFESGKKAGQSISLPCWGQSTTIR